MAPMDDATAHSLLQAAWDGGVRAFDTAPHYGLGLSERRLGAFLADRPREAFTVSTKVGRLLVPDPEGEGLDLANDFHVPADHRRVWDLSADGIRRSVEDSLERLGLDRIDVALLHDPERHDLEQGVREALPALVALREEGLVSAVGVGSMDAEALLACARTGALDLMMAAGRFSLLDQSVVPETLAECRRHGTQVLAASVFNSGVLAREDGDGLFDYAPAPAAVRERVATLREVCRRHGVPLPTAALHYPLTEPLVAAVVVAGATGAQVSENLDRLDTPVPQALWDDLRALGLHLP
ncbi:aldo/keto reductase [Nocardioides sp. GY 10127]|nr:aldo/keto reductase [Nocardioides sp. GY 10127]